MAATVDASLLRRFVAHTEQMVSPKDVGRLYARAEMLARLPLAAQRWIVAHAGADPHVGFIVEPYCLFLAYEIDDLAKARALLPADYRLSPTSMFADGRPRHAGIIGAFNVHSSVFWGSRVELYLIAEHTPTGMLSWVICDYESNTINYDPGQGFSGATTSRAVITTSHRGDVIVDVRSKERGNRLAVTAALPGATMRALDPRLWIDGNLSIDYGGRLMAEESQPFGLIFDPAEMESALDVPLSALTLQHNTFGAGLFADTPFEVACFPYAQHFLTPSYPQPSGITDVEGLAAAVRSLTEAAGD